MYSKPMIFFLSKFKQNQIRYSWHGWSDVTLLEEFDELLKKSFLEDYVFHIKNYVELQS